MKAIVTGSMACIVVVALLGPVAVAMRQQRDQRHFHVVREGVLYRSAQFSVDGLARAVHDRGIRTVVSLRDGTTSDEKAEEAYCQARRLRFVRIKPLSWDGVQGTAPVDAGLKQFLEVMANPANHPVLIHCYRGIHRTGGYVAVYRMEMENWRKEDALEEMRAMGYVQLDLHADVRAYMASYQRTGKYRLAAPTW